MAKIVVLEVKAGLYPGVFKFADKGMVSDTRLQPFRHKLKRMTIAERMLMRTEDHIRVDKLYGTPVLFHTCKRLFESNPNDANNIIRLQYVTAESYVHFINSWLAIIDHYGLDADYDPEFVRLVNDFTLMVIGREAYQILPQVAPIDENRTIRQKLTEELKTRRFHGRFYTDIEFDEVFYRFLNKYNIFP